jgi:hypothetical protein
MTTGDGICFGHLRPVIPLGATMDIFNWMITLDIISEGDSMKCIVHHIPK